MKNLNEDKTIFSIIEDTQIDEETKLSLLNNKKFKNNTLWLSKDNNNNTILTRACCLNLKQIINLILSRISSCSITNQQLASYINHQNDKGYTALLYCAFNGNAYLMHTLITQYHANISITANTKQNVIHLACQRNHPNVIVYAASYEKKMINDKDIYGNTPLHWAVYSNSNDCVDYLIGYCQCDINSVNNENMTPLHIAAKENNKFFIRKLITLKANVDVFDKNKETPYMILSKQKKGNDALKYFSVWNSVFNKKYFKFSIFVLSIIISEILLQQALFNTKEGYLLFKQISGTLTLFQVYFIFNFSFLSKNTLPLKNITEQNLLDLVLNKNNLRFICPWCRVNNDVDKRAKHCFICHKCIENRRHHCQWLNACVSNSNKKEYLFLLISNTVINLFRLISCFIFYRNLYKIEFLFLFVFYLIPFILLNVILLTN